ncbi:hypothetical protein ASPSYDRAFT_1165039, partial [Aspergillus sydowii CBS 593.65]
ELILFTSYYGGLALVGYHCLWKIALRRNNVPLAIKSVLQTGRFADGTPLIRQYIRLQSLDRKLVPAVLFYNGLLDGTNPIHRLLLVDIHSTMQAMAICMLISARSHSPSVISLVIPTAWNMFNQFYGAAFVYPVYLLVEAATTGFRVLSPVDDTQSQSALLASAILGFILPGLFLWPAFFQCSIDRRQRGIALYRFSPIMLSLLQLIGENVPLTRVIPPCSQATPYFVAGLAATVGHWYAIWGALVLALRRAHGRKRGRGKLVEAMGCTFGELYLPRSTETNRSGSSVLAPAAHEFLQYDVIILVAAYLPCTYFLLMPVSSLPAGS